jgi:DNA modification methylase
MSLKFKEGYPDYDLSSLPKYVRDQIDDAVITGKSKKIVLTPDGKKYHLGNKLNHLSGAEWTYYTNSVINTKFTTTGKDSDAHKIRKIHPSPKPPKLIKDIIEFFTKENDWVFDYFMGVGATLLAASMSNRQAVGIELDKKYVDAYEKANDFLELSKQKTFVGDSREIIKDSKFINEYKSKFKLVVIDPPYQDMMSRVKTGEDIAKYGKMGTPFTKSDQDFGNMTEKQFWIELVRLIESTSHLLSQGAHMAIFIKDMQPIEKNHNLLHAKLIEKVNELDDFRYIGMKIWADQTANLYPYGYPYSFVATQIHQYIVFFKKT